MSLRIFHFFVFLLPLFLFFPVTETIHGEEKPISFGLTSVILDDQADILNRWQVYLEQRLRRPVTFIQRRSYAEITDLLLKEQLDIAWVCGRPYVRHQNQFHLLAVPSYLGEPYYRSYVIVSAEDRNTRSIFDLAGKVYAFSDPDSNSGHLVPTVMLRKAGAEPESFFRKTFFTWSHRDVVEAVADGLADGGSVDGYVWDTLQLKDPELTQRTRLVSRSEKYGFPPLVTRPSLSPGEIQTLRDLLTQMNENPEGLKLLEEMNLDGFVQGNDGLFNSIRESVMYVLSN